MRVKGTLMVENSLEVFGFKNWELLLYIKADSQSIFLAR